MEEVVRADRVEARIAELNGFQHVGLNRGRGVAANASGGS